MRDLLLFGERNTSTNALKQLILRNSGSAPEHVPPALRPSKVKKDDWLLAILKKSRHFQHWRQDRIWRNASILHTWKHAATYFDDPSVFENHKVIFTVRHPASWLVALHRRPHNAKVKVPRNFQDFLYVSWPTLERERLGKSVLTPPALYNKKIESYLFFCEQLTGLGIQHRFVRFEDFAQDQAAVFYAIRALLKDPVETPRPIEASTKDKNKDFAVYRDYYAKEKWRGEIDEGAKHLINREICWDLVRQFGYDPL